MISFSIPSFNPFCIALELLSSNSHQLEAAGLRDLGVKPVQIDSLLRDGRRSGERFALLLAEVDQPRVEFPPYRYHLSRNVGGRQSDL